jgi:methylmalonyl-CoA mutase N-terminal domain/subunit
VIAYESGVSAHVDPFGGSHVVEDATDRLEHEANGLIAEIDAMGGMVSAIERGFPQREIQNAAYATQTAIESKKQIVVGVNDFVEQEPPPADILRVAPHVEPEQVARLQAFRGRRNEAAVRASLDALAQAAAGSENTMPRILSAVEAHATLGEVADTLRGVFGEYQESVVV